MQDVCIVSLLKYVGNKYGYNKFYTNFNRYEVSYGSHYRYSKYQYLFTFNDKTALVSWIDTQVSSKIKWFRLHGYVNLDDFITEYNESLQQVKDEKSCFIFRLLKSLKKYTTQAFKKCLVNSK